MIRGKRFANGLPVYGLIVVFALLIAAGCGGNGGSQQGTADVVQAGEKLFNTNCSTSVTALAPSGPTRVRP